ESVPDPADPQFAPIRADLARLFIAHKAELGIADWADDKVVDQVSWIASALIACGMVALQRGDQAWLERHAWFGEAIEPISQRCRSTGDAQAVTAGAATPSARRYATRLPPCRPPS